MLPKISGTTSVKVFLQGKLTQKNILYLRVQWLQNTLNVRRDLGNLTDKHVDQSVQINQNSW